MDGWADGWMMRRSMNGWMDDGLMDGCMIGDGWMIGDGCMHEWMNGWWTGDGSTTCLES